MKSTVYKLECLTNLHMGSGDVNYNIIDNEVEKDSVTGYPIIHASGIKGALRDAMANTLGKDKTNAVFGARGEGDSGKPGIHKFLDANLIARPMRVLGSKSSPSILVFTIASVNQYLQKLTAFGLNDYGIDAIEIPEFNNNSFLTNSAENISVEGEKTGKLPSELVLQFKKLADVLGETFAIADSFDSYELPVVARNYLENGISKNLWYEELVPHGSVMYFSVICEDNQEALKIPEIVQFGGNASIGCGFCRITRLKGEC